MKLWQWVVLLVYIISFVSLSVGSAFSESLTFDEIVHREEGLNHWYSHTFNIDQYNPPLMREVETIPVILGSDKMMNSDILSVKYFPSRLVTIFLAVLLLIALFLTTRKYFGTNSGLLAISLLALQPNFLAHSHYLTLDVGTALFVFLAYIFLVETATNSDPKNFLLLSIFSGLALASRVSALPFLILNSIFVFLVEVGKISWLKKFAWSLVISGIIVFLTLWSCYFFRFDILPNRLSEKYMSEAKKQDNQFLVDLLDFSQNQKIPLGLYFNTLKKSFLRSGQGARIFFLGRYYSHNFWYFLPINTFLKTPIAFWVLLLWGIIGLYRHKKQRRTLSLFIFPAIMITLLFSFGNASPWVRYALPVYPFLALVIAGSLKEFRGFYRNLALSALILWFACSSLSFYPHFISYVNELAGPQDKLYKIFADSNLDWGQALPGLVKYVNKINPKLVSFSYFGRDNADPYGLVSNFPYGDYRFENICRFHEIFRPQDHGARIIAISVTNWYDCGFSKLNEFSENKIKEVVGNSILIFR